MTNIFSRKPLKTSNAVAKRYEPWISVFERLVSDAQKKVTELSKQERLYNIIKEFMELQGLPNDTKIFIEPSGIYITVNALPTNKAADIMEFNAKLGRRLFDEGLRIIKDDPNLAWGGSYHHDVVGYFCINHDTLGDVHTRWVVPKTGISDLEVKTERKEITMYDTQYKLVPRTQELPNASV